MLPEGPGALDPNPPAPEANTSNPPTSTTRRVLLHVSEKICTSRNRLVCLTNIDSVHLAYPMPTLPGNLFSLSPLLRAYCPRRKSDLSRISSGHIRTSVHSFGIDSAAVTLRYLGLFVMSAVTQSSLIPASSRPTCVVSICQASRRRLLVMCSPHGTAMAGTDQPTC